jgi:manganese transport protein
MKMGEFVNPLWQKILAYTIAVTIASLNFWLLAQVFGEWFTE